MTEAAQIYLTFAIALSAVVYIEIGSQMTKGGLQRAKAPVGPIARTTLVLFWPLALIYGLIAVNLGSKK